jgi:hypothetical protein
MFCKAAHSAHTAHLTSVRYVQNRILADALMRQVSPGWSAYPNLHRRPHAPNLGRGRLQRQIARAFIVHGDVVSATDIYCWCRPRSSRFGMPERWSIVRILRVIADPVGRAPTIGRPWIWRLKTPAADTTSAPPY